MAQFDSTFAPYHPFGSRELHLESPSMHGTDVAVLQAVYDVMVRSMNPPLGPMGSRIAIDGYFGPQTRQAVLNIQSYFGIETDGIVGPNTFFLFGQGIGPHTTYGGPIYGSQTLVEGDSGGDVTILQNRLNCFRYAKIIGKPAMGQFNHDTARAVGAFKHDAEAHGDTGFPDNSIAGFGFYDATWIYTFAGGRAIFTGRNGFDVVFIQIFLKQLGYYTGRFIGYYDDATHDAVERFQQDNHIAVDGVIGPETFYHIGLHNDNPAPVPELIAWPTMS